MKNLAITRRDAEVKLLLDILSEQVWNVPTDFSVSIQKEDYHLDDYDVARASLRFFPNQYNFIMDTALTELLACTQALRLRMSVENRHGSPCIMVTIHKSIKR